MSHHDHDDSDNPLQGYFDWQVTTLMLAHDLADPIPPGAVEANQKRRFKTEQEVRDMTLAVLPETYKHDPNREWPPELFMDITRTTLTRAAIIAGIVDESM